MDDKAGEMGVGGEKSQLQGRKRGDRELGDRATKWGPGLHLG